MSESKVSCNICKSLLCDFQDRFVEVTLKKVGASFQGTLVNVRNNFVLLQDGETIYILCCDDICTVQPTD